MKKLFILLGIFTLFSLLPQQQAAATQQPYLYEEPSYSDQAFEAEELEDLVAPIALYPDPLIAQLLPAATFIDQVEDAARHVRRYGVTPAIDQQPWDISVKAVAHYPDLLLKMDRDYDWTVSLGQAFISQQEELFSAIQRLRADAYELGNLVSTREQQVVLEGNYIRIYPADPRLIYLPSYDPRVIYVERAYPGYGLITFGAGLSIGVWLNRDFDWYRHRIYYHGWRGDGWIRHARPHVHLQNRYYVQPRTTIIINRSIIHHDTSRYRRELRHERQLRPPPAPHPASPLRERHAPRIHKAPEKRPTQPPAFQRPRPKQPDVKPQPPRIKDRAEELRAVKPTAPQPVRPHREQRGMQTAPPRQPSTVPATVKPAVVRPAPAATPPPAAVKPAVKPAPAVPPAPSKASSAATGKERPQRPDKPEKRERNEKDEDRPKR